MTTTLAATSTITRAGEGTSVTAFGSEIVFMLTGEQTGGSMTLGLATVPAGDGPPPHVHHREDELFIIVEGRYGVFANGEWTEAGPGAVVYLPRGQAHTFRNLGETPARHWVLTTPSGFERFYQECAGVFAGPAAPDLGRIVKIAGDHGIEFV